MRMKLLEKVYEMVCESELCMEQKYEGWMRGGRRLI